MNPHTHFRNSLQMAQHSPLAAGHPDRRNWLAWLAILAPLLLCLTLSGCAGLTQAGAPGPGKSSSNAQVASNGTLAANATNFSFGNVGNGSSKTQTLTLTNTGTAAVTVSGGTVSGAGFSIVGGISAVSIPGGQSQSFQIQFAPQSVGAASGNITISSNATDSSLIVSLDGTGATALSITAQPINQSVMTGQKANFSVSATGTGTVTYQWKKNGVAISGANYASYTTPPTVAGDNGAVYTVVVADSTGSSADTAAMLSVTTNPVAPSITTQPAAQSVAAGQSATFSVVASGTATLAYQWTKNGSAIAGATGATYTTPATSASDNGALFAVTVSNSQGSIGSNTVALTVNNPPAITAQPASQTVAGGQTATFIVAASGTPTLTYQWFKSGSPIGGATSTSYTTPATSASDNGAVFSVTVTNGVGNVTSSGATLTVNVAPSIVTQPAAQTVAAGQTATFAVTAAGTAYQWNKNGAAIGGANSASYTTPATAATDSGALFTVSVTNSYGSVTSNAATLTVNVPPTITAQPGSQTVTVGQTATFTVAATGSGTLTYQWKKNGTVIKGATSAAYTTPAAAASDDASQFTVTVTGTTGSVTSNAATLSVNAPASIASQPANQTVNAGQTATFSVAAAGTPTLTYQWSKNGAAIGGATSASYTTPATALTDSGATFTVTVANTYGSVTSNAATLTVNVPPTITSQPVSQTVTAGQTASFTVAATGSGTLTYQWKKNGTAIGGATSASYTTPAAAASDNGALFSVTVTGNMGSMSSNAATLTVNVPPSITAQPASTTVIVGQTATFSVTCSGTPTLTYQWNKNGAAINGATSYSYTTPATASSDSGAQITVTVSNSVGSVTSNAATLTVNAAASPLNANVSSLSFGSVNIGSSSVQSVTFTNAGGSNITIAGVSISGAGYSATGISTGQILTAGQTATLSVTFTPASTGSLPGSVTVASNATNSPATVTLSGTGAQPVSHSVTLSWSASSSSVTGYNVYRSTVSGGPYTKLNSSLIATTSYTDTAVVAGQTYYYVVTSVDSSNMESAYSNEVSALVP
jgi:hypothetical protein